VAGQKRKVSCSQCVSDRTPPSATVPIGNSGAGTRGIRRVRSRSFRADPYVVTEAAASGQRPTQGMRVRVGPNSRGEDGQTRAEHFPFKESPDPLGGWVKMEKSGSVSQESSRHVATVADALRRRRLARPPSGGACRASRVAFAPVPVVRPRHESKTPQRQRCPACGQKRQRQRGQRKRRHRRGAANSAVNSGRGEAQPVRG
jgi:hypothetical protein